MRMLEAAVSACCLEEIVGDAVGMVFALKSSGNLALAQQRLLGKVLLVWAQIQMSVHLRLWAQACAG